MSAPEEIHSINQADCMRPSRSIFMIGS